MTRPLASRVRLRLSRSLSTLALCAAGVLVAEAGPRATAVHRIGGQGDQAAGAATYVPAADDLEMRYALSLSVARRGDLDGAIATLADLAARSPQGDLGAHVAADLERTRAFQALRTKYLAGLAESGGELRLEIKGREITFVVQTIEPERVVFRNTAFGIGSVPLAELDSVQIAKQIGRDFNGDSGRWVRLYPYLLAGDERGPQFLKRDCKGLPEADKLLADAEQWYPAMVSLADAAALFAEIGANPSALTADRAKEMLASIKELVAKHGTLDAVRGRMPQLRDLAKQCLAQTYDAKDLIEKLAGRVENLENGGVRLVYEFDSDKELKDFKTTPPYPAERIALLPPLKAYATQGVFELKKSALVAAGTQSWRHIMPFKGPITVRCRMQVEPTAKGGAPTCFWMFGACDNGAESYLGLQELGTAIAIDLPTSHAATAEVAASKRLQVGTPYELELVYDGQTLRTKVAKQVVKEVPSGPRSYGDVFFLVHSDSPIRFDRIEIEVQPGGLGDRGPWMREKLRELGLGDD